MAHDNYSMNTSAKEITSRLSIEEKTSLCTGKNFWFMKGVPEENIPDTAMNDGPHGLRKQEGGADNLGITASVPATCFPTAATLACSWDKKLVADVGAAIAEECLQEGVSILLGPGINIKRHPLCGRNFEYYSEDPLLSGELGASFVQGVQKMGVGTSLKHYAANNQEYHRMVTDAVIDERALREIYLTGFEIVVKKAAPWTVMAAYNRLNGTYLCDNRRLLTDILRNEWGFKGIVISDWGAVNDRAAGITAGMDLEMPGTGTANTRKIIEAVKGGKLKQEDLDTSVCRLLETALMAKENLKKDFTYDKEKHHSLARRAAAESAVLLKNEKKTLPLQRDKSIAVLGDLARVPRYQGNGSSLINPLKLETGYDELKKLHNSSDKIYYAKGYQSDSEKTDESLLQEALNLAEKAETVIIFAGLPPVFESEGYDRNHLNLPDNQNTLIREIASRHERVIVLLSNGAPVLMPWLDEAEAVIEMYLGGEASGGAAADILFGEVNPGGKLAETFPLNMKDIAADPYFPGSPRQVQYREGLYVGYRYFDSAQSDVLFPFGFGLSYTHFEYSEMILSSPLINENEELTVSCRITNRGETAGHETVQLYVHDSESTVYRPEQELKGFEKVFLKPGEDDKVTFTLDRRSFAFYDTGSKGWQVEEGDFEIRIGASSRDIRLRENLTVTSNFSSSVSSPQGYAEPDHFPFSIDDKDFSLLLGREIPSIEAVRPFNLNSTIDEVREKFLGRLLYRLVLKEAMKMLGDDSDATTEKIIDYGVRETPLKSIVLMSGGEFSYRLVEGIIHFLNGKYLKGTARLFKN